MLAMLFACSKSEVKIPTNVLPQKKMHEVLVDVHIAQAASSMNALNDTVSYSLADYMPALLRLHKISRAQFDTSMNFYAANPELLDNIYKEVIDELNKKQGEEDAAVQ